MEIKLTNVARASQEELLADYKDFLRVRNLPIWPKDSKEALFVRKLGHKSHTNYESYKTFAETRSATANERGLHAKDVHPEIIRRSDSFLRKGIRNFGSGSELQY